MENGKPENGKFKYGFTLIELLVTVTIIALLTGMGLTVFSRAQANARDSKRKADLEALRTALEQYFAETKAYPPGAGSACTGTCTTGWPGSGDISPCLTPLVPDRIKNLPTDPSSGTSTPYRYRTTTDCSTYCLEANLEITPSPILNRCTSVYTPQAGYDYLIGNP